MAQFTDCLGREWKLRLTTDQLKPLREKFQLDVIGMTNFGQFIELVFGDPERFASVVHLLARPPAEMTADEFAAGFDGPTIERATVAVLEAIADFSPRSLIAKWRKERIGELLATFDHHLIRSVSSSGDATNSPAPPEGSTPAP